MGIIFALQLFPVVLAAIFAVENVVATEPGATKKKLILDSVTAVLAATNGKLDPKVMAFAGTMIDAVVGVVNVLQLFGKGAPASPAA